MRSIVVSHPHCARVSAEVAGAFARAGRLSAFVTGAAFAADGWIGDRLAARWPVLRNRIVPDVPGARLRARMVGEAAARAAASVIRTAGFDAKTYDCLFVAHDAGVALARWPRSADAIYAYEDGALRTFRRAARREMARIWDLPTRHYKVTQELWREEVRAWPDAIDRPPHREPDWKMRRKDAELALATTISVASAYTKRTLQNLEVRVPIVVTPYGFPVERFAPKPARPSGRFTVLSVGVHDLPKGTPYLLEAWKRAAIPDAELRLVGDLRLGKSFLDGYAGLFRHVAPVPQAMLVDHYFDADVLAFPTLGDGFGLVIQEAMCCGTAVIGTPTSGAPECITHGVDGWLVPERNVDALVELLRAAAADRDRLFEMGRAARARAERWSWREAGEALVEGLTV